MTRSIRWIVLASALALLIGTELRAQSRSQAQAKGKPAPEELTGLKVGAKAPSFTLKDQDGKDRSLDDLLKRGKVALVFYRSADW